MKNVRDLITPESLALIRTVATQGSMAAAAREMGLVPSAVTYRVRQIEDALDVLLFDRSAKQARITPAGEELLQGGEHVLQELDAVARRVQRVATGWEPQLTIAVDSLISKRTMLELCEAFFACGEKGLPPPTRLRIQSETLSGTWHALIDGQADLSIGGVVDGIAQAGIQAKPLGDVPFVFAVAPHHPLANCPQALAKQPLQDAVIQEHRIVAVADSTRRKQSVTVGILPGQDVLTVSNMPDKLDAQLRGLGCGFVPHCIAQPYVESGRLVLLTTERIPRTPRVNYAWHTPARGTLGKALSWWLAQLAQTTTREALLFKH
ncbi:LysR family transcriptional regulator [Variovorax sp. PCZ-1]|uniref:LysR family transcriptional regulator n=1 Tax=Variovorax sp. PCZ-1 TaxID=2835533 RepID=UPI001BCB6F20|nr:LysR family transcriptional regulator [Variovorax sp. PCZ-1]MBS7806465.1 LysR family transcriptional regulator [Variovorax sp. PCZ-1]